MRTFCGKTQEEMRDVLFLLCDIEDETDLNDKEQELFDVAIQCVTVILNRMTEDRPIPWDD